MTHFADILRTIGATSAGLKEQQNSWSFWKAQFDTPVGSTYGYYLYLKSICQLREGNNANRQRWYELSESNEYEVIVTPKSRLNQYLDRTARQFGGRSAKSSQTFIREILMENIRFRNVDTTDSFVDPDLVPLSSPERRVKGLEMFTTWISHDDADPLLVLLGDGGMGKTTLV